MTVDSTSAAGTGTMERYVLCTLLLFEFNSPSACIG